MTSDFASEHPGPMGWIPDIDKEHRLYDKLEETVPDRVCRQDPKPPFNQELLDQTKQLQQEDGIEDGFCFLHFCKAIFGEELPWLKQLIGSCVASGAMRTMSYRMLAEVFLLNDREELPGIDIEGKDAFAPFGPYHYAAGRKIGGLMRPGSGDGSFCAAQITGLQQYGALTCDSGVESDRYPEPQSTSLYRKWGNSNTLLQKWADEGKQRPLVESEKVKSFDDAKELLTRHYKPINICSMWGFAPSHKHESWRLDNGDAVYVYKKSGQWAHNMSIVGVVKVQGEWFVIVENSWGSTHRNGRWFVIRASLFSSWIRQAEAMSVGEIDMTDNPPVWPED